MTLGQILLCIGFGLAYITMNVIPLIVYIIFIFEKDVRKNSTINDWLFETIICTLILIPFAGSLIGCAFTNEEKWLTRLRMISVDIIIIGTIIAIIQILEL